MTWKSRWNKARYSNLTIIGRIALTLLTIGLIFLPVLIFGPIEITDMNPGTENVLLGGFVTILLAITALGLSLIVIIIIWTFISWIFTGESKLDILTRVLDNILFPTTTLFRVFFSSYENKWYFLKEWFQKDKIAKELLGEE